MTQATHARNPTPLSLKEEQELALQNWKKSAGGKYKGRLYGAGPYVPLIRRGVNSICTSGASTNLPTVENSANVAHVKTQQQQQADIASYQDHTRPLEGDIEKMRWQPAKMMRKWSKMQWSRMQQPPASPIRAESIF